MNSSSNPLVSVYIPSFNRPELALRAVNSVLKQSYSPIQLILCNDGSTDSDYSNIINLIEAHNGIYIENDRSLGAPASRNKAIELANGKYITGLDDDDEFTPDRIERLIASYDSRYSFVATSYYEQSIDHTIPRTYDNGIIDYQGLLHYNKIGNQIFTETDRMRAMGGFDISLPAMQDHEFWIRMTKQYGPGLKTKDLTYVVHTEHDSQRISASSRNKEVAMQLLQKKHAADLSNRHYDTHKLIIKRAKQEQLTLIELFKCVNRTNYRLAISSYLSKKKWRK